MNSNILGVIIFLYCLFEGVSKLIYFIGVYQNKVYGDWEWVYQEAGTRLGFIYNICKNIIWAIFPCTPIFWFIKLMQFLITSFFETWKELEPEYEDKLVKHKKKRQLSINKGE